MRLEPYEGKLSSTVLRGGSGSNVTSLPDDDAWARTAPENHDAHPIADVYPRSPVALDQWSPRYPRRCTSRFLTASPHFYANMVDQDRRFGRSFAAELLGKTVVIRNEANRDADVAQGTLEARPDVVAVAAFGIDGGG